MKSLNPSTLEVHQSKRAVYSLFFCFGFVHLSVLSRLVGISTLLGNLGARETAGLLLCITIGDVITSLSAGIILDKVSKKIVTTSFAVFSAIAIILIGVFINTGQYNLTLVGFFLFGLSLGGFNIGMNMMASNIEGHLEETLMPRFHSFYNLGAVAASTVSEIVTLPILNLNIIYQYCFVGIVILGTAIFSTKFTFRYDIGKTKEEALDNVPLLTKLKSLDITILLIALIIVANELTEGSGNNWVPKAIEETFKITENLAIPVLWLNLVTATIVRFFGHHLSDKLGVFKTLTLGFCSAIIGVAIICLTPWWPLCYLGAIFWGGGIALGYPLAISMVASDKKNGAFKTSVVATLGGLLNIATPPLLGEAGHLFGIRNTLLICIPLLLIGIFCINKLKNYFDSK
jgi:MFS family permease